MIDPREGGWIMTIPLGLDDPFTRSNGTVMSRLYERLTKASRRRVTTGYTPMIEDSYRKGVYDAYKTLQEELSN